MSGKAAFTLDALEHRGFFAAHICAGTAAQMERSRFQQIGFFKLRDFIGEDRPDRRVFVAEIDVVKPLLPTPTSRSGRLPEICEGHVP